MESAAYCRAQVPVSSPLIIKIIIDVPLSYLPSLKQSLVDRLGAKLDRFLLYISPPERLMMKSCKNITTSLLRYPWSNPEGRSKLRLPPDLTRPELTRPDLTRPDLTPTRNLTLNSLLK